MVEDTADISGTDAQVERRASHIPELECFMTRCGASGNVLTKSLDLGEM